jgi:hypothetical protein
MHKFEFTPDDLFINRLKTYAEYNVFIYQSKMSINRGVQPNGSGGLVVYDINANRSGTDKVYPFVETGSLKNVFKKYKYQPIIKNYTGEHFNIHKYWLEASGGLAENASVVANNGLVTSSYSSESPIKRNLTSRVSTISANYWNISSSALITGQVIALPNSTNLSASALQNVARKYTTLSNHFIFVSSSIRSRDLVYDSNNINFITIPSMYYGSTIKKGSVELNYYITGSKIATCADTSHNGTLIGTTGSTSGSVVGLVLYDEGIIMLTSSNPIAPSDNNGIIYDGVSALTSSWLYYGTTLNDGTGSSNTLASASYDLNFKGTNYVNSLTMFAHAKKGHLNHSNNPTYRDLSVQKINTTGSGLTFVEGTTALANVVSASYVSASFEKTTYISKVNIYDEDGNLIAITSMAKPIKKTLTDEFTFKMKLDL